MGFAFRIEGDIERDVVVAGDDDLEFCGVGPEEGDGELVLGEEAGGGEVAGVDEDGGLGKGMVEGQVCAGEVGSGGVEEVGV